MQYSWKRYGGYEVSTHGDKRLSAFCALKGYDKGGTNWRLGKGKPPLNPISKEYLWDEYISLWWQWAEANPELMNELKVHADKYNRVLSDKFATTPINQARALSTILNYM